MGLRSPQAPKSPVVTELEVRADKARPAAPVYRRVSTDQLDRRLSEPTEPRRGVSGGDQKKKNRKILLE